LTVSGQVDDSSITDVSGDVKLTGDYYGDMQLSKLAKGFTFRSSRTDLEMAKLEGDLNMNPGDLRASNMLGPVKVTTKATDIHLDGVSGEVRVENSEDGNIEVHSEIGAGTRFELSFPEAVAMKRSEPAVVEQAPAAMHTAHAVSTQVISTQSVPQQAVAQTDRLIR